MVSADAGSVGVLSVGMAGTWVGSVSGEVPGGWRTISLRRGPREGVAMVWEEETGVATVWEEEAGVARVAEGVSGVARVAEEERGVAAALEEETGVARVAGPGRGVATTAESERGETAEPGVTSRFSGLDFLVFFGVE